MIINQSFTGGKIAVIPAEENPVFWTSQPWTWEWIQWIQTKFLNNQNLLHHHHTKTPPTPHHIVWPFTFDICQTFIPH